MGDFLAQMAAASRERAEKTRHRYRGHELDKPLAPLALERYDLIAELKDASPSTGALAKDGADRLARARRYAEGGAAAVSVLTEPSRFAGRIEHLAEVAASLTPHGVPVMRKDFLVDRVQLYEARAAGASGVLLIAAMLDDVTLADMLTCALDLGLFVLLESFDAGDLERTAALSKAPRVREAAAGGRFLAGVNTRNLRTLEVDAKRLAALAARLPEGIACVAESGLATAADVAESARLGYRLGLVGTALMKSDEPEALIRDMLAAGRAKIAS